MSTANNILNKMNTISIKAEDLANIGPNISNSLSTTTTYGWSKAPCDCQGSSSISYKKIIVNPGDMYDAAIEAIRRYDPSYKYTPPAAYTPERIIYNNPATVVFWKDGTKTVVKKAKGEKFNKYYAFCAALAKKMYKNNSRVNKIVNSGVDQTTKKKKAKKANG